MIEWRNGLVEDNNTWAVVDRGDPNSKETVPVWQLIENEKAFHQDRKIDVTDRFLLQKALEATYTDKYVSINQEHTHNNLYRLLHGNWEKQLQ